jgi:hypothetical protein
MTIVLVLQLQRLDAVIGSSSRRWLSLTSDAGRAAGLYPFRKGHYLGSRAGEMVLAEAGLDGERQARAIADYVGRRRSSAGAREMDA